MYKVVGDYQLKEKIGKGNFADVYLGVHRATGAKFAIKAISKELFVEPKLLAGLESEIRIMKDLIHPNIIQLFKYFSSEKNFYLVVEFCAGGDLSKYIRKHTKLSEITALNFLYQLSEGIHFLHENRFIHRDLKPANVLLCEAADDAIILKLADFGFARTLNIAALAQTRCGTPLYMAPEILEAREYDGKADIWSIGCIFYEMLVGTCPFKGVNEADLLNNIRSKSLRIPNTVEVSKLSVDILVKLLERSSSRRASTEQLLSITRRIHNEMAVVRSSGHKLNNSFTSRQPNGMVRSGSHEKLSSFSVTGSSSGKFVSQNLATSNSMKEPQKKSSGVTASSSGGNNGTTTEETHHRMYFKESDAIASSPPRSDTNYIDDIHRIRATSQDGNVSPLVPSNSLTAGKGGTPSTVSSKLSTAKGFSIGSPNSLPSPSTPSATVNITVQTLFPSVDDNQENPSNYSNSASVNSSPSVPNLAIPKGATHNTSRDQSNSSMSIPTASDYPSNQDEDFVLIDNQQVVQPSITKLPAKSSTGYFASAVGNMLAVVSGANSNHSEMLAVNPSNSVCSANQLDLAEGKILPSDTAFFLQHLLARCELFCDTVRVISSFADHTVQKHQPFLANIYPNFSGYNLLNVSTPNRVANMGGLSILPNNVSTTTNAPPYTSGLSNPSHSTEISFEHSTETQTNRPNIVQHASTTQLEQHFEQIAAACSLYLHALRILEHLMYSIEQYQKEIMSVSINATKQLDSNDGSYPSSFTTSCLNPLGRLQSEQQASASTALFTTIYSKLLSDLVIMHEDLLIRCDHCQQLLQKYQSFCQQQRVETIPTSNKSFHIPRAEYYMLQQALQSENNANTEELLGHFGKAYNHYLVAKQLIQGITLTYAQVNDPNSYEDTSQNHLTVAFGDPDNYQKTAASTVSPTASSNNRIISSQLQAFWESLDQKLSVCYSKCQLLQGFGLEDVDECLTRYSQ